MVLVFCVFVYYLVVVSNNAVSCLERPEMSNYVSDVMSTPPLVHSYTCTLVHSYSTLVHLYTRTVHLYTRTLLHLYTRTLVLLGTETVAVKFTHANCQLYIVFSCSVTDDSSRHSGGQGSRCCFCLVCSTLLQATDVTCHLRLNRYH